MKLCAYNHHITSHHYSYNLVKLASSLIQILLDIILHQLIISLVQLFFPGSLALSFESRVFFTGIIIICFAFSSLYGFSFLRRSFIQDKILIIRAGFLASFLSLLFIFTSEIYIEPAIIIVSLAIFFTLKIFLVYCLRSVLMKAAPAFALENEADGSDKVCTQNNNPDKNFQHDESLRKDSHRNMREIYARKSKFYKFIKRAFDIISSGSALLILSPVFIITAIAIKLEDGGPVFYAASRYGKDLKNFKMVKFRSMVVNAESKIKDLLKDNEMTGHTFKIKDDPRITRVGKFIRKYSIDELPQLFNIFIGSMSVVGPRPIMTVNTENIDDYDKQRWTVQPGLTCYWQISGRADVKWAEWVEMDLDYIENMSFLEDLKIIFKTVPIVFKADGAY